MKHPLPVGYMLEQLELVVDKEWHGLLVRKMNREELLAVLGDVLERLGRYEDLDGMEKWG